MEALEMERPMTEWNDGRLDELNGRVNEGFEKVDERFIRLEGEMKEGFARVDKRFEQVATRESIVDLKAETRGSIVDLKGSVADLKGSIAETNERLNRLDVRMDRLYWAFVVLVVMLAGNFIAHSV
jgi:hypothetical protein